MSLEKVLNDWKEYDQKKIKDGLDPLYFIWNESWEIHYLKTKIKYVYPVYDELMIFEAIDASCISEKIKIVRSDFVKKVLAILDTCNA